MAKVPGDPSQQKEPADTLHLLEKTDSAPINSEDTNEFAAGFCEALFRHGLDQTSAAHLEKIRILRLKFLEEDNDQGRQIYANAALMHTGAIVGKLADWAIQYHVGLAVEWKNERVTESPEQVLSAAKNYKFDNLETNRIFLGHLLTTVSKFANIPGLFDLGCALPMLNWGGVHPLFERSKTGQSGTSFFEWHHRVWALLHLEYLLGYRWKGRREGAKNAVADAYDIEVSTLEEWTKTRSWPPQLNRENLTLWKKRIRRMGEQDFERQTSEDVSGIESDWGIDRLKINGEIYQEWHLGIEAGDKSR
jgi:hypothetical protein